jgi:hypothetical protein
MDTQSSHLAQGTTLPPPPRRVTATAKIFQREIVAFAVRFAGLSHFFPRDSKWKTFFPSTPRLNNGNVEGPGGRSGEAVFGC